MAAAADAATETAAVSSGPFVADIVLIASHREHGNSHFKAKRYAEAIASYETALAANIETGGVVLQQQLQEQLLLCNLNAAACYLKIADPRSAKQRCDTALELDATSNKGLYRRAAAHFELREFASASADLKACLAVDPSNKAAKAMLQSAGLEVAAAAGLSKASASEPTDFQSELKRLGKAPQGSMGMDEIRERMRSMLVKQAEVEKKQGGELSLDNSGSATPRPPSQGVDLAGLADRITADRTVINRTASVSGPSAAPAIDPAELQQSKIRVQMLHKEGHEAFQRGDLEVSIAKHNTCLQAAQQLGGPEAPLRRRIEGVCHGINGSAYLRLCQYPAAVSSLEQATTHPMDPADAAEQLANLGMAYSGVEAYGKALAVHSKALAYFERAGHDKRSESDQHGCIGNVCISLGKYDAAIDSLKRALALAREIGDRQGEGAHLGNLGLAFIKLEQYDNAIGNFKQALAIAQAVDDAQGKSHNLASLGNAYIRLEEHEKALVFLQQALSLAKQVGDRHGEGEQMAHIGAAHINLGQHGLAVGFLKQALQISRETTGGAGDPTVVNHLEIARKGPQTPNVEEVDE